MLLDEQRMKCALESLYKQVMLERGMRDDFCGIGHSKGNEDADEDTPVVSVVEEEDEAVTPSSSKVRKGVSFHEDTKAGRASAPIIETSKETKKNALPMRMYRPPSKHIRCSLGLVMYYVQVNIEDIHENNEDTKLLQRVMSVLLPDYSLATLKSNKKQSGVILLTVGMIGPSYDLYGSPLMASLPMRLQEGISTLAALDTTPKKEEVVLTENHLEKKKKGKASKLAIAPFLTGLVGSPAEYIPLLVKPSYSVPVQP
jgi:hypothetical protein